MRRFPACVHLALGAALLAAPGFAATIVLQNGAQPTAAYAGTIDAFVTNGTANNASPTGNYGGAGAIAVSASPAVNPANTQGEFRSLVQFDVAAAKSAFDSQFGAGLWTVTLVQLGLTAQLPNNAIFNGFSTLSNTAGSIDVRWLTDDTWVEGTGTPSAPGAAGLTYNNLPGFTGAGDEALGSFSFAGGTSGVSTAGLALTPGFVSDLLGGGKATFELLASSGSQANAVFFSRSNGTTGNRPSLSITAVAVPEPGRFWLLVSAAAAMLLRRKRMTFSPCQTD